MPSSSVKSVKILFPTLIQSRAEVWGLASREARLTAGNLIDGGHQHMFWAPGVFYDDISWSKATRRIHEADERSYLCCDQSPSMAPQWSHHPMLCSKDAFTWILDYLLH